ncbi:MAG TPA: enoyl-CoA hydratase [Burkholderiaceae bacterium]|nr:enoyl-CoA hydratase [Burkholderiaceae bacterium]
MSDCIFTQQADGVLQIEIRRPDKKNALTSPMYTALAAAVSAGQADPAVRVLLLRGLPDVFSAGNDMQDFLQASAAAAPVAPEDSQALAFMRALSQLDKPVLAAVNGLAIGVGTTLLLHCDQVYASASARFQLPFVSLGLCPEFGASLLLAQRAGYQRAARLLMFAEPFDAAIARECGLVSEVLEDGGADSRALARAYHLAKLPPAALRLTKQLLKQSDGPALQARLVEEMSCLVERARSPEAKEAFTAFVQKRPPDFSRFH